MNRLYIYIYIYVYIHTLYVCICALSLLISFPDIQNKCLDTYQGERWGWDELGDWNWHIYILVLYIKYIPGGGNGTPRQHSCLENPMDRGAWWATVHGVAESDTTQRLNNNSIKQITNEIVQKRALYLMLPGDPDADSLWIATSLSLPPWLLYVGQSGLLRLILHMSSFACPGSSLYSRQVLTSEQNSCRQRGRLSQQISCSHVEGHGGSTSQIQDRLEGFIGQTATHSKKGHPWVALEYVGCK